MPMSIEALHRCRDVISEAPDLTDGYSVRFFRWSDSEAQQDEPTILFRSDGGGVSNSLLQQIDVRVILIGRASSVVTDAERVADIVRRLRTDSQSVNATTRVSMAGEAMGPVYLDNGRPWWEIPARVWTEDQ